MQSCEPPRGTGQAGIWALTPTYAKAVLLLFVCYIQLNHKIQNIKEALLRKKFNKAYNLLF